MAEELENQTEVVDTNMYIDEIKQLKQNTVSKDAYQKLQEENRNLLKSLVEGQTMSAPVEEVKPSRSEEEIIKDLINPDKSNLDDVKLALELHDKRLERGYNDFLPIGHELVPTDEDIAAAKRVEEGLRAYVDGAEGDPDVFNDIYQRSVVDVQIPRRK